MQLSRMPSDTSMAPTLQADFLDAVSRAQSLSQRPAPATLLRLYALYKQASSGDAQGERPGAMDFVARAKWDAWAAMRGQDSAHAMAAYIRQVQDLEATP
jgi:acyl-CoA-binding protein